MSFHSTLSFMVSLKELNVFFKNSPTWPPTSATLPPTWLKVSVAWSFHSSENWEETFSFVSFHWPFHCSLRMFFSSSSSAVFLVLWVANFSSNCASKTCKSFRWTCSSSVNASNSSFVSNVPISSTTSLISSLMPAISALTSSNSAEARLAFVANSSRILSKFSRSFSALSCVFSSNGSTVGPSDSPFSNASIKSATWSSLFVVPIFCVSTFSAAFSICFSSFSVAIFSNKINASSDVRIPFFTNSNTRSLSFMDIASLANFSLNSVFLTCIIMPCFWSFVIGLKNDFFSLVRTSFIKSVHFTLKKLGIGLKKAVS